MKKLEHVVDNVLRKLFKIKYGTTFAEIAINWHRIVGASYFNKAYPVKIYSSRNKAHKSTLYVNVKNTSISLELSYQKDIILERISLLFGYKAIDELIIKVVPDN